MYLSRFSFLLIFFLILGCSSEGVNGNPDPNPEPDNPQQDNPIYLDENGVTINCYDWGEVGDTGEINGITYTIVDETILREMIDNNEDVSIVCTTKITDMRDIISEFYTRISFNQDISSWDVSNVTHMGYMFFNVEFNGDISLWDVSSVDIMTEVFQRSTFNQPIGNWDVSNVTFMSSLFKDSDFNQPLDNWNVSNVIDMSGMFEKSKFNQPIGNWDVSSVTQMSFMFSDSPFNQDISSWSVDNVTFCNEFSLNTPQWVLPKPNFTNCSE